METWKSHVRAALIQRDCLQKDPFSGLFTKGQSTKGHDQWLSLYQINISLKTSLSSV